jgi:hypothetical protein
MLRESLVIIDNPLDPVEKESVKMVVKSYD